MLVLVLSSIGSRFVTTARSIVNTDADEIMEELWHDQKAEANIHHDCFLEVCDDHLLTIVFIDQQEVQKKHYDRWNGAEAQVDARVAQIYVLKC